MITISGLTKKQVELLDTMWDLVDIEDYENWKNSLDENTMNEVDTLEQMVLLAQSDEIVDCDCDKAMAYLGKFML
jgi:hypothetical protein